MHYFYLSLVWIGALALFIVLSLRGGERYTAHDANEHATTFGDGLREAHGPVTALLWVSYGVITIFTIAYSIAHRAEFAEMWRMMWGG